MNARADFIAYKGRVFRNFATLHPSQNLMDDLVDSPKEQEILGRFYYDEHLPSRMERPAERVYQKSLRSLVQSEIDSKFKPQKWFVTRFSDGGWPVLYSAESEETALREVVHHLKAFYHEELQKSPRVLDRRVVALDLKSKACADLMKTRDPRLTSKDESGYPHCQKLAKKLLDEGAELLRTPSARHTGGVCVPIFKTAVIAKDRGHLRYLKLVLSAQGCEVLASSQLIPFD